MIDYTVSYDGEKKLKRYDELTPKDCFIHSMCDRSSAVVLLRTEGKFPVELHSGMTLSSFNNEDLVVMVEPENQIKFIS